MASVPALFRLPRELRDEIFDFVFDDTNPERVVFTRPKHYTGTEIKRPLQDLPPLCRVSQQLYLEATPRYLGRATLSSSSASNTEWLIQWLATFPCGSGYRAIRQMVFRNFHGHEQSNGYELISLCHNLRVLNIMFGDEFSDPGNLPSLSMSAISTSWAVYEMADDIIAKYQMHKIVDISKLGHLQFGFHDWEQPVSTERARKIKEWLNTKLAARGRNAEVMCRQMEWGTVRPDNYLVAMFGRWNATN